MDRIKAFYNLAKTYCHFITENEITSDTVSSLMELLMKLYVLALRLPETEPETIDRLTEDKTDFPSVRISNQIPLSYWEVSDPFVQEEAVCGDISDDLNDIASDLKIGMKEFEVGRTGNAVFEWKFGLNNHWGNHTIDVLRALHALRTR